MKAIIPRPFTGALALGAAALVVLSGCKPEAPPSSSSSSPGSEPAATVKTTAAEPEPAPALEPQGSFNEVMSLLDEGGGMLLYLGTDQIYEKLSSKVAEFKELMKNATGAKVNQEGQEQIMQYFDVARKLLDRTGISEISGMGISDVEIGEGLHRMRALLHHYPDKGAGYFWRFFGAEPHEPAGLRLMPTDTVVAFEQDLDLKGIWQVLTNELHAVGNEEISGDLAKTPAEFKKATGMELGALLDSLGGQYGMAVTLDQTERIKVPTDNGGTAEVPRPDAVVYAKVNDRLLFDRLAELSKEMPEAVITNVNGLDQIQFGSVFPPMPTFKPVVAFDGDNLLVCSSTDILETVMAVKAGRQPSLTESENFKRLAAYAATKGNGWSFIDKRLEIELQKYQSVAMDEDDAEGKAIDKFLNQLGDPTDGYGVFENTDQGWIYTSVSSQDSSTLLLAAGAIAPAAIIAGMTVPAISKARTKAQRIKCVNNLKQLSLGLKIYASDNGDLFPFHVPTGKGGTMDKSQPDTRGDDTKPFLHMLAIKDILGSPRILTCPAHEGIEPAMDWDDAMAKQMSYRVRSGKMVTDHASDEVLIWCPIHHNVAVSSGAVHQLDESATDAREKGSWTIGGKDEF